MLRSTTRLYVAEREFTLERILQGAFDEDLRAWARGARDTGVPMFAEYGTEMNGDWFPWNASWNQNPPGENRPRDAYGAELFRRTYRHIITVCRRAGATNILWVFHVNGEDAPALSWNRFETYYPGSEWIDWLGVSIYGAQTPADPGWPTFRSSMDNAYARLHRLDPHKPVLVAEFGVTVAHPRGDQAAWAEAALRDLLGRRWPTVAGFVWWNGAWENGGAPRTHTSMRLADNPALARVFSALLAQPSPVVEPAADR
jgi:hypothetical protein